MSVAVDYQTPQRMAAKRAAIPLPHMFNKRVLDVGCDMGFWSFLAADKGADFVLGLDRNREVRGVGYVDLVALNRLRAADEGRGETVSFEEIDLGKQWREFGRFDVIFCLSMYHHWYEAAGGAHLPIWFWLWRHCRVSGVVMWEGPVDDGDPVVRANVSEPHRAGYTRERILTAAEVYFDAEYIGPALHEPTRLVYRLKPKPLARSSAQAVVQVGAGGATKAFEYNGGRRIAEIERAIGIRPVPGSLNLRIDGLFDWGVGYYRARVLDVTDRRAGLESEWSPRWARFYPLTIEGSDAWAFRFEGEHYDRSFLELIAPQKLRDVIAGPEVTVAR